MGNGVSRYVFCFCLTFHILINGFITGILMAVDGYMNLQIANTEEFIDGVNQGSLGEVLIR